MSFFRRPEKRQVAFEFARILVPLVGDDDIDKPALKVASLLLAGREGVEVALLHVIEIPFERNLDTEDSAATERAEKVLARAEALLAEAGVPVRPLTVQARAAGPASQPFDTGSARGTLVV